MDEAEYEKKWKSSGLPKLEGNLAGTVQDGVPDLTWVDAGHIKGAWVIKDGLLLYHFYKRDRKDVYDNAQAEMDDARKTCSKEQLPVAQQRIAEHANSEFEKRPWWPEFKTVVEGVFKDHFRYSSFKIDYYREVDSWSIVMPEPNTPIKWTKEQYETPFFAISRLLGS
jgi:hypothetical protein